MRVLLITVIAFILSLSLVSTILAQEIKGYTYEFDNPERTIVFSSEDAFTQEKMNVIAESFVSVNNAEGQNNSRNIICSIIGHNLSTSEVLVITHKVSHYDPRCRLDVYDVTGCSRCDYTEQVLISSGRISCHPEELPLPENTNPTE